MNSPDFTWVGISQPNAAWSRCDERGCPFLGRSSSHCYFFSCGAQGTMHSQQFVELKPVTEPVCVVLKGSVTNIAIC
jgi:hypothetical protein